MEEITLRAEPRKTAGSRIARRMRRAHQVPAVLYGREIETIPLVIDAGELEAVLHTAAGSNVLINLEIDGERHLTLPREVQRNPVKDEFLHVDFLKLSRSETVQVEVPIHLEGTPETVKENVGVTEQIRGMVRIEALPEDLPSHVILEIGHLDLGDVLRIADLPQLGGVTYLDDPEDPIVTVAIPRLEIPEPEEEVADVEELLEGEELPEGEEPPEGEEAEEAEPE